MVPHNELNIPCCSSNAIQETIVYAASKLLSGANPNLATSFCEETMFGVASVLCRLGLRPYSSTPLALRAVSNFMSVLCYVSYTHEQYVSSYISDPMLALGAARLWYSLDNALVHHILPQFRKLMLQEVVDTGEIGEVVARILLLLAMDECSAATGIATHWMQFQSVNAFMSMLRGQKVTLERDVKHITIQNQQKKFDDKWKNWKIGFRHFVQLALEPTEECLWYMLSRRAAGVFPRNQNGADIFIPNFTCDGDGKNAKVSMILVHVKNYGSSAKSAIKEALPKLRPNYIFDSSNSLSAVAPDEVVRVIMSLRRRSTPTRYYAFDDEEKGKSNEVVQANEENEKDAADDVENKVDKGKAKAKPKAKPKPNAKGWYVLCLEGFRDGSFIPEGVTKQLNLLLAPWWDITKLVKEDLTRCRKEKKMYPLTEEKLTRFARYPLSRFFYGEFDDDRGFPKTRRGASLNEAPAKKTRQNDDEE